MKEMLFPLLTVQLMAMACEVFSVENVQSVFARLHTALKCAAAKSGKPVESWVLDHLERCASDPSSAADFRQHVLELLETTNANVICHLSSEDERRLQAEMAIEFAVHWACNSPVF